MCVVDKVFLVHFHGDHISASRHLGRLWASSSGVLIFHVQSIQQKMPQNDSQYINRDMKEQNDLAIPSIHFLPCATLLYQSPSSLPLLVVCQSSFMLTPAMTTNRILHQDMSDDLPFWEVSQNDDNHVRPDAGSSTAMLLSGDFLATWDMHRGSGCDTAVEAWKMSVASVQSW